MVQTALAQVHLCNVTGDGYLLSQIQLQTILPNQIRIPRFDTNTKDFDQSRKKQLKKKSINCYQ